MIKYIKWVTHPLASLLLCTTFYGSILLSGDNLPSAKANPNIASGPKGASAGNPINNKFTITDEDLDLFESMGFSRDEASKMADFIGGMSEDQLQEFAKIGQQIEQEMVKAGADPNNPDDVFNFFSSGNLPAIEPNENAPANEETGNVPAPKPTPTPIKQPVVNPEATKNVTILLDELLEYIASLRQKASASPELSHKLEGPLKQELDELTYYLHVLNKEQLKPFVVAKEAAPLYNGLKTLHEVLATYEPLIQTKHFFEESFDNPYKVLNLEFGASSKELEEHFALLKEKYDPELVQKRLIEEGLPAKDIARQIKAAKLHYQEIKDAYESLSNPKEKAQIDKMLKARLAQKQEAEALSLRAFTQCSSAITIAFYKDNVIKHIQSLLGRYAPEEKKKADEWEKTQKQALEAQKKLETSAVSRSKTSQTQGTQGLRTAASQQQETGKQFWSTYRPPEVRGAPAPSKGFGGSTEPKPAAPSAKPSSGGPSDGGKGGSGGGGKKEEKKPEKKDEKGDKGDKKEGKKITLEEKDIAKVTNFATLLHPDELGKLKKEVFKQEKILPPGDYKEKDTVQNLFFDELPKSLMVPYRPTRSINLDEEAEPSELTTLDKIDAFMKAYNLDQVSQDLAKLAEKIGDAGDSEKDAFKSIWQSYAKNNEKVIAGLKNLLQNSLGFKGLDNSNGLFTTRSRTSTIHKSQLAHHQLGQDASKKGGKTPKGPLKPTDAGYLEYVRKTLTTLVEQFEKLNGKLKSKSEKAEPKPEKKEPKEAAPKSEAPELPVE